MQKNVLTESGQYSVDADDGLQLTPADMERTTGWRLTSEGLCEGDVCVPAREVAVAGRIDAAAFWRRQGNVALSDGSGETWVLGAGASARRDALAHLDAPDFELPDVNGVPRRLSSLRGNKVVLATWASWCGCRTDLPVWQALYRDLKNRSFMVVAIAEDSGGPDRARPWIEQAKAEFWCLVDREHRVSDLYGLVNVPEAVWIDERGRIVRPPENPGWTDEWRHNAQRLLGMSSEERKRSGGLMSAEQAKARDAGRLAYMKAVADWVRAGVHALPPDDLKRRMPSITPEIAQAQAHFRLGVWLRQHGKEIEGDRHLAEASRLHPESWCIWRQAADLAETGKAGGSEFLARVAALGDKRYYPPPDLPGFENR